LTSAESWRNSYFLKKASIARAAIRQGAQRVVVFSAIGNERLLRRMGVDVYKLPSARLIDGKPALAFWIDVGGNKSDARARSIQIRYPTPSQPRLRLVSTEPNAWELTSRFYALCGRD